MQNVLFIGQVFPESSSTAAGSRMLQLLAVFKDFGNITFASTAQKSAYSDDLDFLGIDCVAIALNNASFDTFILDLNPLIVVFDRFVTEEQFGWRVAQQCPKAMRILDTEDLHCLRFARQIVFQKKEIFSISKFKTLDITKREIASIYRCDLSLLISGKEYELLTQEFKISEKILMTIPFMVDAVSEKEIAQLPSFEKRQDFMTIGNFLHQPNWQAVLVLKNTVWPLIRKTLPKARLLIYGAYTSKKVTDLHNEKQGFIVKGRAVSAAKVISEAKVMLAPILFGAGLKGKLLEAMQYGTPSVTTAVGAEGMRNGLPWNGLITNNLQEFEAHAIRLYTNKDFWLQAQAMGIEMVNTNFSKKKFTAKLISKITTIQSQLTQHRKENFVGAMLLHHTLQSTKYLSKWIEAKNK